MPAFEYRFASLPQIQAAFLHSAEALCREIETYQPDLLVSLMHSSRMLVEVTALLWQKTRQAPFPPVIKTNIGREKTNIYILEQPREDWMFYRVHFDEQDRGRLWAWLETRPQWQDQLRRQTAQVCGPEFLPHKILIVDEFVFMGVTAAFAAGLTGLAFPNASIKFSAGYLDEWCQAMYRAWLAAFHPQILPLVPDKDAFDADSEKIEDQISLLVPGTEDVAPDSLDWQPIRPGSPLLDPLLRLLPADEWLQMPPWVEQTLLAGVDAFLNGGPLTDIPAQPAGWLQTMVLGPVARIIREAVAGRELTSRRIANLCNCTQAKAARMLAQLCEDDLLTFHGDGSTRNYVIFPRPSALRTIKAPTPQQALNAFWLVPDQALVSRSPFSSSKDITKGLHWLVHDCRIDRILLLDQPYSHNSLNDLKHKLLGNRRRGAETLRVETILTSPLSCQDTVEAWLPVLERFEQALERGERLFVQDTRWPVRTGVLAGMYLIRHGCSAAQAMRTLEAWGEGLPSEGLPCPLRSAHRKLLKEFARRESA